MKITKKNGHEAMYDDEKVISSILKANEGTSEKTLTRTIAASIAADVFSRLTAENTIITTAEVRECVDLILRECGSYPAGKRIYRNSKALYRIQKTMIKQKNPGNIRDFRFLFPFLSCGLRLFCFAFFLPAVHDPDP